MGEPLAFLMAATESGGMFMPFLFILLHLLRPVFFIPAAVVCAAGGMLFGTAAGMFYSLIGLLLSSFQFYIFINNMPKTNKKLNELKVKWFGEDRNLTAGQIAVMRLLPFVHYHLLNFCLLQKNKSLLSFMKASFFVNLPPAFLYTAFGENIKRFSPPAVLFFIFFLSVLIYILRDRKTVIKWREFF